MQNEAQLLQGNCLFAEKVAETQAPETGNIVVLYYTVCNWPQKSDNPATGNLVVLCYAIYSPHRGIRLEFLRLGKVD